MAFSLISSNVTAGTNAETEATLKAFFNANPASGMHEGGAFIFRGCGLSIPTATSLTISDGSNLAFDDAGAHRVNISGTGLLNFRFGGGIIYNGNVQHTFFNGRLDGENVVYTLNANVASGRSDFFSATTSNLSTLKNLSLVFGKGATGYTYFTHLEQLAGRIDGLRLINNVSTSLGTGHINTQFGNGAYNNVSLPKPLSNYGITTTQNIYLARGGGNSLLTSPVINDATLVIVGDTNGTAELRDETWATLAKGKMGRIVAGASNSNQTTVARTQTFNVGSLFDGADNIFVRLTDSQGVPVVYKNGAITAADAYILQWASYVRNGDTQTNRYPFYLVARRWNTVEQTRTYNYAANTNDWDSPFGNSPFTYSALNVVDAYATNKETALTGIVFNSATKTVTLSAPMTLDKMYDYAKYYLTQNLSIVNFISPSGKVLELLDGWMIAGIEHLTAGPKLSGIKTAAATASGAISNISIVGNVTQATPTNLTDVTITGSLTYNHAANVSVDFTNTTVTGTVSNAGAGTVTVLKINSSLVPGTRVVDITSSTVIITGLVSGSRIIAKKVIDGSVLANIVESGGVASFTTNYVGAISIEARKASGAPYYQSWSTQVTTVASVTTTVTALQQRDD